MPMVETGIVAVHHQIGITIPCLTGTDVLVGKFVIDNLLFKGKIIFNDRYDLLSLILRQCINNEIDLYDRRSYYSSTGDW